MTRTACGLNVREAGVALVLVLWAISLLTIMAGSYALTVQRETASTHFGKSRAEALAAVEGGIHLALHMLNQPDPLDRWLTDGSRYRFRVGEIDVEAFVTDEAGKMDLNAVRENLLRGVLHSVIDDLSQADRIADAILDWRDPDELKRLQGAELADYQAAGKPYGPRNKPFQTVDELRLVLGMTPEIYRALEPIVTRYTSLDSINPQKASREMLLKLPNVNPADVDTYIAARRIQRGSGQPPPQLPPIPGINFSGNGDLVYEIAATARPPEGAAVNVRTIVRRGGGTSLPFGVLSWKQSTVPPPPDDEGT